MQAALRLEALLGFLTSQIAECSEGPNDYFFFFFRTHFTAAWVFLLLRMQNGEKIKDFIIHFHCLTVKVSQMG